MSDWQEAEHRVEKAHELYERGRWEEALAELRAAIAINPYNGAWHFNLGLTLDMMERFEEAIGAYESALEMDPDDVEILSAIGADCTRCGKYDQAIGHFQRIEAVDPTIETCYCNRIYCYTEKNDHDRAEEMFYLARQYKEKCPLCFYNMGLSLFARGQNDRALWCWRQVLELEPEHPQVHARIAEAHWAKGQHAEARTHFIEELRANPGDIDTLLDLGELLIEMDHPQAAAEKFRQVLELEPDEATAHFHLGELAAEDGDPALGLQQFKRVLRHDKLYPGAHLRIAQLYHKQADTAEALYHANCELAQPEATEEILMELGNLLMDLAQHAGAQAAFNRVLALNPSRAEARHNLAVALLLTGHLDQGIEQCKLALRHQPKYMLAMNNLALAYLTKKDFTRAKFWLREALDIAPDDHQLRALHTRLRLKLMAHRLAHLPTTVKSLVLGNRQ